MDKWGQKHYFSKHSSTKNVEMPSNALQEISNKNHPLMHTIIMFATVLTMNVKQCQVEVEEITKKSLQ